MATVLPATSVNCTVCLEDIDSTANSGDRGVILHPAASGDPHQFHIGCVKEIIDHNIQNKSSNILPCPICRIQLIPKDLEPFWGILFENGIPVVVVENSFVKTVYTVTVANVSFGLLCIIIQGWPLIISDFFEPIYLLITIGYPLLSMFAVFIGALIGQMEFGGLNRSTVVSAFQIATESLLPLNIANTVIYYVIQAFLNSCSLNQRVKDNAGLLIFSVIGFAISQFILRLPNQIAGVSESYHTALQIGTQDGHMETHFKIVPPKIRA